MRILNSPEYVAFRAKIYKRDKKCKFPNCRYQGQRLQVHHIKRAADFPELEFIESNAILLCLKHHREVWGKERDYEPLFIQLVSIPNRVVPRKEKIEHQLETASVLARIYRRLGESPS